MELFLACFAAFMRQLFLPILLLSSLAVFPAHSSGASDDRFIDIPTRPGITVPVISMERSNALATIVLLPGGHGSFSVKRDGPESDDFLVKNRKQFARRGFTVAVVGKPNDIRNLSLERRRTADHLEDIRQVVKYLQNETSLPIWLVGTSRGTVSAASFAIAFGNEDLAGVVLTSSVTSTLEPYGVPRLRLEKIQIPVLILHHEKDPCKICDPAGVPEIAGHLSNAPIARVIMVSGGWLPTGNPCSWRRRGGG